MSSTSDPTSPPQTPAIPLSPVLSGPGLRLRSPPRQAPSILDCGERIHVTSGRAAIALALEHAGIKAGDEVLIPAFHCESMVSPVKWRGATPVFYQINADTSLNVADLEKRINSNTKAILVTHYFGFLQNMAPIADLCQRHKLLLIEDCAHAFFGSRNGTAVGGWGDYAIASTMKFFPVYDGGILASTKHALTLPKLDAPGMRFQIKSFFNTLEKAIAYQRLGVFGKAVKCVVWIKEWSWNIIKGASMVRGGAPLGPESSDGGYGLDEQWIHKTISEPSRWIIKHSDLERIVVQRRKNYTKLEEALRDINGTRALFDQLPPNTFPLVYPLYVDDPQRYFKPLKDKGVPIWRFGEYLDVQIDEHVCKNSVKLSRHVFQFPCHQELTDIEMDWMIQQIKNVLTDSTP